MSENEYLEEYYLLIDFNTGNEVYRVDSEGFHKMFELTRKKNVYQFSKEAKDMQYNNYFNLDTYLCELSFNDARSCWQDGIDYFKVIKTYYFHNNDDGF